MSMKISGMPLHALALIALPLTPIPGSSQAAQPVAAVEACVTAATQAERSVTFAGQMTAIAGAQRMAMRIEVEERTPADLAFRTVVAPGLGVWRQSAGGVKIYRYLKQVTNLAAPASYRALVRYRWTDDRGRVIRRGHRRTPVCEQPEEAGAAEGVRHTTSPPATA